MEKPIVVSAEDYKLVFYHSPAAKLLISTDAPHYTIIDVNEAYNLSTNTTREFLLGQPVFGAFPANPSDNDSKNIERTIFSFEQAIRTKKAHTMYNYRYDIPVPGKPGEFEERYWTTSNTPVMDDAGNVKFLIHSPLNVTEIIKLSEKEKQSAEALLRQREQLYSIFMQAPVGIGIFLGPEYRVELINQPLCDLYGSTFDEMINKPVFEILTHAKGLGFEELLDNVRDTGIPFIGEGLAVPLVRKGQLETVYVNFVYEPFRENDGTITGVIGIAIEVTNQVIIKQQLQVSEQRLSLAIASSNQGVWDLDLTTGNIERSLKYAEIFGDNEPSNQWTIDDVWNHIFPDDLKKVKDVFSASQLSGKLNIEFRIVLPGGKIRWVHVVGESLAETESQHQRMLGTIQDITQRKDMEKQKDEFISIVSHELKTPITSLKAYGQIVEKRLATLEDKTSYSMIKKMSENISRLTTLVQDLVDVTRIENNKLQFRISDFSFNELVKDVAEEIGRIYPEHQIIIENKSEVIIHNDRERTEQVIRNLVSNAIKYSPGADKVIIHITRENDKMICSIEDFGIGISPEQQPYVFERFYQAADHKANPFPGLGLGLYICRQIIDRQGGTISVKSELNKGSVFTITLPLDNFN
ncbi:MAG: yycG 3 [Chitinophagaceae bacterium]|nr:yycG 3 [Chitinophagaceae bacterium]